MEHENTPAFTKKPEECISELFESVDADEYLYAQTYDDFHSCGYCFVQSKVTFPMEECEKAMSDFSLLVRDLKKIAKVSSLLTDNPAYNRCVLGSDRLVDVWKTYIPDNLFTTAEESEMLEIRLKNLNNEYVSENEKRTLEQYYVRIKEEAEKRISPSLFAPELIIHCVRMFRLFELNASAILIENEQIFLATAFIINRYGITAKLYKEEEQPNRHTFGLTEEEEDELYRPKKSNIPKSLTPLFVYMILKEKTTPHTPMHQRELIEILSQYPYEIAIQRKAISRILHTLADSGFGIYTDAVLGSWYDESGIRI